MLEGILYNVVSREEGAATVRLLPESPIYKAHFPGYPVTPGVTLVQMALELMGRKLASAKDIKFVVSYRDDATADITLSLADGTLCTKMTVSLL